MELPPPRLTPAAVCDLVAQAARRYASEHHTKVLVGAAVLVSVAVSYVAHIMGLAVNILWLPHTPAQSVAFLALVAPWVALVLRAARRRPLRT